MVIPFGCLGHGQKFGQGIGLLVPDMCASPERTPAGQTVSDQTVGNILRRYGIQPAPNRSENTTWRDFIASHIAVLAGNRLLHRQSAHLARSRHLLRLVLHSSGIDRRQPRRLTKHPTAEWMIQMARNASDEGSGFLRGMRYLFMIGIQNSAPRFWTLSQRTRRAARSHAWRYRSTMPSAIAFNRSISVLSGRSYFRSGGECR